MKKFLKKVEGFTLVELIVVIAILGILAAVAVPAYTGYMNKAKEASDTQTISAMNTAFAAAMTECLVTTSDISAVSVTDGDSDATTFTPSTIAVTVTTGADAAAKTAKATEIQNAFDRYFTGNNTAAFKYYVGVTYDAATGNFKGTAPTAN